jgi:hypothetical protein
LDYEFDDSADYFLGSDYDEEDDDSGDSGDEEDDDDAISVGLPEKKKGNTL